jgi:hypothetical protein
MTNFCKIFDEVMINSVFLRKDAHWVKEDPRGPEYGLILVCPEPAKMSVQVTKKVRFGTTEYYVTSWTVLVPIEHLEEYLKDPTV